MTASETQNQTQNKNFLYMEKRKAWVVSKMEDVGLEILMNAAHAKTFEKQRPNGTARYWEVAQEEFEPLREILIGLGYTEFVPSDAQTPVVQTSFQIAATSKTSPQIKTEKTYSVKEISQKMNQAISACFPNCVWLRGVITEFNFSNGFYYATLIDKETIALKKKPQISLIIFPNIYHEVIQPKLDEAGLKLSANIEVRILGAVSYYANRGQGSFEIRDIDPHFADGELAKQKKIIEDQLYQMGIHDNNKNLRMPFLPLRLAVFSKMDFSQAEHHDPDTKKDTARGCEDFINTLKASRYPFDITFFNVSLQGEMMETSFLKAFDLLDRIGTDRFDLGIIIRGGGSNLDLFGYNNLKIATYIAKSPLKFIIGVGHDKDRSVLDEIAHREKTPTAIGDLLVNIVRNLEQQTMQAKSNLILFAHRNLTDETQRLKLLQEKCVRVGNDRMNETQSQLRDFKHEIQIAALSQIARKQHQLSEQVADIRQMTTDIITQQKHELDKDRHFIQSSADLANTHARSELNRLKDDLNNSARNILTRAQTQLEQAVTILSERTKDLQARELEKLETYKNKIELLNPSDLFKRGFVAISTEDKKRISSIENVQTGQKIVVRLIDGRIQATIDHIEKTASILDEH